MESNSRWPNSARHGWRGIVHGAPSTLGHAVGHALPDLFCPQHKGLPTSLSLSRPPLARFHRPPPFTLAFSTLYCCSHPSWAPSLSSPHVLVHFHFLLQLYTGGANGKIIVPPIMVVSSLYVWSTDFRPCCCQRRGKDLPFICCNHVNKCEKNKDVDTNTAPSLASYGADSWKYCGCIYT